MRDFQRPGRSAVLTTGAMCATSHPVAAHAAADLMQRGGNAVDAAICAAVLLGVAEPHMTGIGGDCFALISPAGGDDVIAVNGSGRAPAGADAAALRAAGHDAIPPRSAQAVTIPGAIDAFCTMSDRWGRLGLADSLAPAIHYMDAGLPVADRVAWDWARATDGLQAHARSHFLKDGKAPERGTPFRLPGHAEILRRVAKEGRSAFYEGDVAQDMLATLNALGGAHTEADLANTACTIGSPVSGTYKRRELLEHPPNGQGIIAHLMLNILSQFDLSALDPFGALRVHLEAEATKLAYDARNRFLADPDHMTRLDHLLSQQTAQELAALIDPARAMPAPAALTEAVHKDTVLITAVDRDRMAVSLIYSIFHEFGSGIASEKFGVLFQNRGAGFTLTDGHPNVLAGGKRPMHTIIPAMLRDEGRVSMAFGVMGGQYQPAGHARVMTNLLDFGLPLQTALDAPRSFAENGVLRLETGYGEAVRAELRAMGHDVTWADAPIGGAQAIAIHADGVLEGASDPRKDGCAIGF